MRVKLNRTFKWPYREPERDYPLQRTFGGSRPVFRRSAKMSLPGRRYTYRPHIQGNNTLPPINVDAFNETGLPPPNARNIRCYTIPGKATTPQEPIYIVPPKKEPRYITMEVKEPDPEPIVVMPPPPPMQKVYEYEVPVKPKEPEPIFVPVYPPQKQEFVTVRQVVEDSGPGLPATLPATMPAPIQTRQRITRLMDDERSDTLLGVKRTLLWELVLASFVLFILMLLIAIFLAGFLST